MFIGSAMRTAPPCNNATPAAAAESFAMASLSDIVVNPVCLWRGMQTVCTSPKSSILLMSEEADGQSD
ncbi:MAG: hypothetical protein GW858_11585 [Sphingomonadales bacterium]|nr:hypothetical protein [Sphingomonadales bacterium]NCQ22430.1 hypothetical protein [Sphingomonadales bacterium]NCT04753.1 hypothetical protein [Sphingomonadales bacterium]